MTRLLRNALLPLSLVTLMACGSNTPSTTDNPNPERGDTVTATDNAPMSAPAGDITHYGAVTIGDDAGVAADLVAGFYRLERGVSADFMNTFLSGDTTLCRVDDDDVIDFEDISAGFIPRIPGVGNSAASAGDSVLLSSPGGTFATLFEQPVSGFLFYDLPDRSMLGETAFPEMLRIDVSGSSEIPAFTAVPVPDIAPLGTVDFGNEVRANTTFRWDAGPQASGAGTNALIRIVTSTAGGFFLEDGVSVSCLTPDTGTFEFPESVQTALGDDFIGSPPMVSRVTVNPVRAETTVLFAIRESFAVSSN